MPITLLITTGLANVHLVEIHKCIWPMIAVLAAVLVLCAAVPSTITYIPRLLIR
jgi:TRAP-type C4-dicarboxylate transport system permease large subunit